VIWLINQSVQPEGRKKMVIINREREQIRSGVWRQGSSCLNPNKNPARFANDKCDTWMFPKSKGGPKKAKENFSRFHLDGTIGYRMKVG
jgi:hypothetical protein